MRIIAAIPPRENALGTRSFRFVTADVVPSNEVARFKFQDYNETSITIVDGDSPVLAYNHGPVTDERISQSDPSRSRACYIHPVWGIGGEVLTDDFPADHIHHHGIFWTWPHVTVGSVHHDLWLGNTLKDRFVGWIARETGPLAAVLAVENGWFVGERKVMIERVWMTVHKVSDDSRALDLECTWIPVDQPITLRGAEEKGYGGLSMRFAPRSERDAVIAVPSGRASEDLVMARLPWADFTAPMIGGPATPSGAAVMARPDDPDFPPEWMARHYGAMCPGWPGTTGKTLEPGKPVRLAYRVWIHKSAVSLDVLKNAYAAYETAAKATWK